MKDQLIPLLIVLAVLGANTSLVAAQIAPDNTLGTTVETLDRQYKITGGEQVGNNLFHSFSQFSIPAGSAASFEYSSTVNNVFSRVTGNSVSRIDGLIQTPTNSTASLFLLNPNGIIFGQNAGLNIGGSFLASTAKSIVFADGSQFSTDLGATSSLLTLSVPVGLQLGSHPGAIVNRSQHEGVGLQVHPQQTLALVGGPVTLEQGFLTALAGRIELGSVGEGGFVNLTPVPAGWQLDYQNVNAFQDILSQKSSINATGSGGTLEIQARQFTVAGGLGFSLGVTNAQSGGNLLINATESVEIIGFAGLTNQVLPGATGNAGQIVINTPSLKLKNGGVIDATTIGQGQGGQIIINASEEVEVSGVNPPTTSLIQTSTAVGRGDGGQITINTKRLNVNDGGQILAVTFGQGNGGTININASEWVEVKGEKTISNIRVAPSLISTTSGFRELNFPAQGNGGNLSINTNRLVVSDGGEINVGSFRGGEAGNLIIDAGSILLNNGKLLADSTSGGGGNIFINASGLLVLRNNSLISATAGTEGAGGDGGNIFINARFILAVPSEDSDIEANAFTGTGGNVNITTNALLGIQFREGNTDLSDITVSSEFGNSGVFSLNRPDVDPQSGLVTLPSEIVDAENVIVQACGTGGAYSRGEFVILGRGGFSPDPYDNLELNIGLPDLGNSTPSRHSSLSSPDTPVRSSSSSEPIIEAQGWVINREGKIVLTAQSKNATASDSQNDPAICHPLPQISLSQ